jgi:hypothetical protein
MDPTISAQRTQRPADPATSQRLGQAKARPLRIERAGFEI